jgi:predicted enzyme related to lactoylglutathione lyase
MDVMGSGRMAVLADPAGAAFTVWQPMAHTGAEIIHEHGTFTWAELSTTDIGATKTFYPKIFPVAMNDYDLGDSATYTVFHVAGKDVAGAMANPSVPPSWGVYFEVNDTDAIADQAIDLGANELMRDDTPPGRIAMLIDPQGAPFAILQSNPDFQM